MPDQVIHHGREHQVNEHDYVGEEAPWRKRDILVACHQVENDVVPAVGVVPVDVDQDERDRGGIQGQKADELLPAPVRDEKVDRVRDGQQNGEVLRQKGEPQQDAGEHVIGQIVALYRLEQDSGGCKREQGQWSVVRYQDADKTKW